MCIPGTVGRTKRCVDGVSPDPRVTRRTLARILVLAKERPLVYLPCHDPDSATRLAECAVLKVGLASSSGGRPATQIDSAIA
jgi:hypothetical protein